MYVKKETGMRWSIESRCDLAGRGVMETEAAGAVTLAFRVGA
jgi:hypothetical protein